jgi:hypothetical protein
MVAPRIPTSEKEYRDLVSQGESETLELKRGLPPQDLVAQTIVALTNTRGGLLVVGADENGEPIGLSEREAIEAHLRLFRITRSLLPQPTEIKILPLGRGYVVIAAIDQVPDGVAPIATSKGQVFLREANSDRLEDLAREILPREAIGRAITAFVAMSFREEEEPALVDYYAAISRAAKNTGLPIDVTRMDLESGDYEISQGIMDKIDEADLIVADFTLSSYNVYFEVGYARGQRKRVIQTARKETVLEFDVHHWRTLFYRNATELEAKLPPEFVASYREITAPE